MALAGDSLAPGVDPVDKTIINTGGASLRIFDFTALGGPLAGQVVNPPVKLEIKAKDIGQVFGLAFDEGTNGGPPNLYAAATSAFGIQIVAGKPDSEGKPVRLKAGAPDARFMEGQFGGLKGAGPGTIWKIDGTTGAVSVFADTGLDGKINSGPGLGDVAYDPKNRSLYVSDLDTGLIHRFALEGNSRSVAQYDHGVAGRPAQKLGSVADDGKRMAITSPAFKPDDPATWGFTQPERRVDAIAVRDGRLYYAVATGPEIWSVGLNADGSFGADPRLETAVKTERPAIISDIVFDAQGRMVLALRGVVKSPYDFSKLVEPDSGDVLRYAPEQPDDPATPGRWKAEPEAYAIGSADGNRGGSGGVALANTYGPDGNVDPTTCSGTLIATGDTLHTTAETAVHGLQIGAVDLVRPGNVPPKQSAFADFDGRQDDKNARGHIGDVEVFQRCDGSAMPPIVDEGGFPPVADGGGGSAGGGFPPVAGGPGAAPEENFPPVADDTAADPNAPNLAVSKTQKCQVIASAAGGATAACDYVIEITNTSRVPFEFGGGGIEDTFSVPPAALPLEGIAGVVKTANGFNVPTPSDVIEPGETVTIPVTRTTFPVPPEGLVVENCASLKFAAAATANQAGTQQVAGDKSVSIASGPKCQPSANGTTQSCSWDINFQNGSNAPAGVLFKFATSSPPLNGFGGGSGTGLTPVGERTILVKGPDIGPNESNVTTLTAEFPLGAPPPNAVLALDSTPVDIAMDPGQGAVGAEGAAAGQGAAAAPVADSDASDNTSCIKFDSNKPDDQGTPTSEPTEQVAGGDGGGQGAEGVPEADASNLAIEKSQSCRMEGTTRARCTYGIKVTNTGKAPFTFGGDAAIEDTFTGATPTELPQLETAFPGVQRTGTGFRVTADGTNVLQPGQSTPEVAFDAAFDVPPGGLKVENCAKLSLPNAGTPLPPGQVPINNLSPGPAPTEKSKGLDKGVKIEGDPICIARGNVQDCEWTVTVENPGTLPFPMGFEFTTSVPNSNIITDGQLSPSRREDGVKTVFEKGPLIAPGTSMTLTVQATVPTGAGPVKGTVSTDLAVDPNAPGTDVNKINDSSSADAGTKPPQELPGVETATGDANPGDNKSCKTFDTKTPVNPDNSPEKANLSILKTAASPGCPLAGPCDFDVTIKNTGPAPVLGDFAIVDEVGSPDPATQALPQRIESLDPAKVDCTHEPTQKKAPCVVRSARLDVGQEVKFRVRVSPGDTWAKGNILRNCMSLTNFTGINDANEGDNTSCATIKLDPFGLQIVKTGGQSCSPGGECEFELDIFNPSKIVHDDPVTVVDGLSGLESAQVISISKVGSADDFPCASPPSALPFSCTGKMTLAPGEHNKYKIAVRLPTNAPASGSFSNCAILSSPETAAAGKTLKARTEREAKKLANSGKQVGTENSSCHAVKLEPKKCYGGMVLTSAGSCDCPGGQEWSSDSNACLTPLTKECPPGWTGPYPDCMPQVSGGTDGVRDNQCSGGMVLVSANRCGCADGTAWNGTACAKAPDPICPEGYQGKYPDCRPVIVSGGTDGSKDTDVCTGDRPVGDYPNCCPRNMYYKNGECRREIADSEPSSPPRKRICKGSRPVGEYPNCCPRGTSYKNGACRGDIERPPQPPPQEPDITLTKICSDGSVVLIWKKCKKRETQPPLPPTPKPPTVATPPCPTGMTGTPPNCSCPPGTTYKRRALGKNKCVPAPAAPPPDTTDYGIYAGPKCPSGFHPVGNGCAPDRSGGPN